MTDQQNITVPRHLTLLGEALGPVIRELEDAIRETEISVGEGVVLEHLHERIRVYGAIIGQLDSAVARLTHNVIERPDIAEKDIYWSVGRFSAQVVEPLIGAHRSLKAPQDNAFETAFRLWAVVSRNVLTQILTWITRIRDVLIRPDEAYQTGAFQMQGNVAMFEINLTLTLPPEMERLKALVEAKAVAMQGRIDHHRIRGAAPFSLADRPDTTIDVEPARDEQMASLTGALAAAANWLKWVLIFDLFDND